MCKFRGLGPALPALLLVFLAVGAFAQDPAEKSRPLKEPYALVLETDLYCSFFLLEGPPGARILAAAGGEKMLIADSEAFYGAPAGDWKAGQILQVLSPGPAVPGVDGRLVFGRGRARILSVEGDRFLAQVEKSCGPVRPGDELRPYEKLSPLVGRDLGYAGAFQGGEVLTGRIIFLPDDHDQLGANGHALIDRGRDNGLEPGQQLTVFSAPQVGAAPRAVANAVVVWTGPAAATVKILSLRDVVHRGDLVQVK